MSVDGDWVALTLLWLVTLGLVVGGLRPVTDRQLHRWSVRLGVLVDDVNDAWTRRQLRRARAIRWTTFAAGLNVGLLSLYMNVIDVERAADFANEFVGIAPFAAAAVGSVIAEIALIQRLPKRRVAAIAVRRWSDYIDRLWLLAVAVAVPVSLLLSIAASVRSDPASELVWFAPVVCLASLVAVTAGVHVVVNRPAVAATEAVRRIDDALRADGAHHIVGAAVALSAIALSGSIGQAFGSSLFLLPFAFVPYLALGIWHGLACTTRWNVDQARLQRA